MLHAALSTLLLVAAATAPTVIPDPVTVRPGHPHLDVAAFSPFEARYVQMGNEMIVQVRRSSGERPVFSVLMIMDGPGGIGVDHFGLSARDLRFAYRNFTFGRWGLEMVHAAAEDGTLSVSRMPLPATSGKARLVSVPVKEPIFDGTLVHWILGMLPLETGYSVSLGSWALTEEGAETYLTPASRVTGREKVAALDGKAFDCWVVETEGRQATFVDYVVRNPPFLIKQVVRPKEGEAMTALHLKTATIVSP